MKTQLEIEEILTYFDVPELVVCKDAMNNKYLSLLINIENQQLEYASIFISVEKLEMYRKGIIDLRKLFLDSETDEWFTMLGNQQLYFSHKNNGVLPSSYLPESGIYYTPVNAMLDCVC